MVFPFFFSVWHSKKHIKLNGISVFFVFCRIWEQFGGKGGASPSPDLKQKQKNQKYHLVLYAFWKAKPKKPEKPFSFIGFFAYHAEKTCKTKWFFWFFWFGIPKNL